MYLPVPVPLILWGNCLEKMGATTAYIMLLHSLKVMVPERCHGTSILEYSLSSFFWVGGSRSKRLHLLSAAVQSLGKLAVLEHF